MFFLLVTLYGWLVAVYSQRDCNIYVDKKLEWTVTNASATPPTSSGWTEFFDDGVIKTWDLKGNPINNGQYTLREAQNNQQCYLAIQWNQGPLDRECVTFSPTLDHQALVGCYVFNQDCLAVCNTTIADAWFSGVVMKK